MRNDQIFVLLLVILLPMSGCFDGGSVGEAEGAQDSVDTSGTTIVNNYYNNTTTSSNTQERTWYSSGGVLFEGWNDGQAIGSGVQRCIEYGPEYDSSTGEYIGEMCKDTSYPEEQSDWNTTMCLDYGGVIDWDNSWQNGNDYRNAPECRIILNTINTSSGEALLIYQASEFYLRSTCMGISSPINYASASTGWSRYTVSDEYNIVAKSAFDCTHEIYRTIGFTSDLEPEEYLWSIVYAIQDTTVV